MEIQLIQKKRHNRCNAKQSTVLILYSQSRESDRVIIEWWEINRRKRFSSSKKKFWKPWRRHHRRGLYQFCSDDNSRTCLPIPPRTISPSSSFFFPSGIDLTSSGEKGTDLYIFNTNQWEIWDHLITEQGVRDYFWVKEPRRVYKNGENSELCVRYFFLFLFKKMFINIFL